MALQDNVAARLAARQAGIPIVNAVPAPVAPKPTPSVASIPFSSVKPAGTTPGSAANIAASQTAQHQISLGTNLYSGAQTAYDQTAQYLKDNPNAQPNNKLYVNGQEYNPQGKAQSDGSYKPYSLDEMRQITGTFGEQQADGSYKFILPQANTTPILDQAAQGLAKNQAYANNLIAQGQEGLTDAQKKIALDKAAGQTTYYNPQTGTFAVVPGNIDQNALDRLMSKTQDGKPGMSLEQALNQLNTQRPQIQQTMGSTGLGGTYDAQGNFVPKTIEQKVSDAIKRIDDQKNAMIQSGLSVDPYQIEQLKIAAANAEYQKAAAESQIQNEQKKSAMMNAAGTGMTADKIASTKQNTPAGVSVSTAKTPATRQDFVNQQRALGKSDSEIRKMIKTLPPEQTGGVNTQNIPQSSVSVGGIEQQTTPTTQTQTASSSTTPETTTTTPTSTTSTPSQETPQPPKVIPDIFAALAASAPPEMQAYIQALGAQASLLGADEMPISRSQFVYGPDGQVIGRPYDAIDTILDREEERISKAQERAESFLKDQYERNEKFNAEQKDLIQAKLNFERDKSVRDQLDINKKTLDQKTIVLALRGGFGSSDGNNEIIEARQKGEQAIVDLNKEFGFKSADISLQFTDLHNKAYDNYVSSYMKVTDDFETRLSNIDMQGISNQQAKSKAINDAYKEYVTGIKDSRKEYAKMVTDATKAIYDEIDKKRDQKFKQEQLGWQIWNNAYDNYKGNVPNSILEQVKRYIPDFDVNGAMKKDGTKTISLTGPALQVSGSFSNYSKKDVANAIEAITAPNIWKGAEGERSAKKSELMSRLYSGEDVGSLMGDIKSLYRTVASGTDQTELTKFDEIAGSANAIQGLLNDYGVEGNSDGSLGAIDSRLNSIASWVGLSSTMYNDLNSTVGGVSAPILSKIYGAVLSPQEMRRALTYIPEMTDKGSVFTTKVANLKRMNEYASEVLIAKKLRLPPPKAPEAIVMSGNRLTGTAQFTNQDMLDTIK